MNAIVHSMLRLRSPFLFVDSFKPLEDGAGVESIFAYTGEEPFFAGHFPGDPVVPGVLLIEAMAQTARLALVWRFDGSLQGYLTGIQRARFNKLVRPPTEVRFVARLPLLQDPSPPGGFFEATCAAFVEGARVARADLTLSIRRDRRMPEDQN